MHKFLNTFIAILYMYMFRAISCSSSGDEVVLTQHLVSSLSVASTTLSYVIIIICVQSSLLPWCKWLLSLYGVWWNTDSHINFRPLFQSHSDSREENHGHRYWTINVGVSTLPRPFLQEFYFLQACSWLEFRQGQKIFSSQKCLVQLWNLPILIFCMYHGLLPGGKAGGTWCWPSPSDRVEFHNEWSYTSTP